MRAYRGVAFLALAALAIQSLSFSPAQTVSATQQAVPGATYTAAINVAGGAVARAATTYGGLPLSFERNMGQAAAGVTYLAHGHGYAVYLTAGQAMIALAPPAATTSAAPAPTASAAALPTVTSPTAATMPTSPTSSAMLVAAAVVAEGTGSGATGVLSPTAIPAPSSSAAATVTSGQPSATATGTAVPSAPASTTTLGLPSATATSTTVLSTATGTTSPSLPSATATGTGVPSTPTSTITPSVPYPSATPQPGRLIGLQLAGATTQAPTAESPLPGIANYFIGSDPSKWITGIPTFGDVRYAGVYPGVDEVFHGNQTQVEYDFTVQPGVDPSVIHLQVSGADRVSLDGSGRLQVVAGDKSLVGEQPALYQDVQGTRQAVSGSYQMEADGTVGFNVAGYDHSKPLTIDPILSYGGYLGGNGQDDGQGIAVDSTGAAYVTGSTYSTNFPGPGGTAGSLGPTTIQDAYVTKFNPAGSALIYSDYVGGGWTENGSGIAVDSSGDAFIAGTSASYNFPGPGGNAVKLGPGTPNSSNFDFYVAKINPSGTAILNGTLIGGSGNESTSPGCLAIDSSGDAYLTGSTLSPDFPGVSGSPTTLGPGTPSSSKSEAVTIKLNASGTALLDSTLIGGTGQDYATALAVDASGDIYATGHTFSSNFPGVSGSPVQIGPGTPSSSYQEAFAVKLNPAGTALLNSTLIGGTAESDGNGIAIDGSGDAYTVGYTVANNFPGASGTAGKLGGGSDGSQGDGFVAKLNPAGTALIYGLYLGGTATDSADAVVLDGAGDAYVVGDSFATDFYTISALQSSSGGGEDAFAAEINPSGSGALFSTYLGGSGTDAAAGAALDAEGNLYVVGNTNSTNFPTAGALQTANGGQYDAFVAKIGATSSGDVPWHPHASARLAAGLTASVDLADGHVDVSAADMSVSGRGLDLTLQHTWDSTLAQSGSSTAAGQGWQTDLTQSMRGAAGQTVTWVFPYANGAYQTPAGLPWQLSVSSGYTLTNVVTGDVLSFDGSGRYLSSADSYGNTNTLSYSGGLPTGDANSGGRALTLAYNGSNLLNDVRSPLYVSSSGALGQHATYAYSGQQLTGLTLGTSTTDTITSTDAITTTFGYTGNQLTTVTTPATHTWTLAYDSLGRLSTITSPISGTVGQTGYTPAYVSRFTYNNGQTIVARGCGTSSELDTTYTLDGQGEPTMVQDGLGHATTFTYDQDHDVLTQTDANHNTTTSIYQYIGANGSYGQVTQTTAPAIHPGYPSNTLTAPTTYFSYTPAATI